MEEHYLGDAVYVSHDGYQLWLTTSDGIRETQRIALEPAVYAALLRYVRDHETSHQHVTYRDSPEEGERA